jgi:tetratricopeptide (TPR) repeat protein
VNVDWRWHTRFRGLLPLSPHALGDSERLLIARPDELEGRKYQILQVETGSEGSADSGEPSRRVSAASSCTPALAATITVETVRQLCLTADAPVLIGVTDDDLYLFRDGRKSRFLPERRVTYLSVALARGGGFFAAAFTDMMFAGQTLALADAGGKVLWTKDMDAPIGVVGLSPEGRVVAAGLENGTLLAFDAGRSLLWEAALDAMPVALALSQEGTRCVVATASGAVLAVDRGDIAWRAELATDASWTTGAVAAICDARGTLAAIAGSGDGDGWVVLLDAEGRTAWEQATAARITGAALSPSGAMLALSQLDGELLLFDVEPGASLAGGGRYAPDEEFQQALVARDAGRTAEAREGLLRVLEAAPGHMAACAALIEVDEALRSQAFAEADRRVSEGRFEEALAALENARAVAPGDMEWPRRWSQLVEAAENHAAGQAARAEAAGDLEEAIEHWRSLLRLDPKRLRARQEVERLHRIVADHWVREGEAALAAGREAEAVAAWQRAQAAAPSEALASRLREAEIQRYLRTGVALYGQQRFQEAAFQLRKVLALQPNHPEALRYLAYIGSAGPQSLLSERFSRLE